jgi:hypothetical protein
MTENDIDYFFASFREGRELLALALRGRCCSAFFVPMDSAQAIASQYGDRQRCLPDLVDLVLRGRSVKTTGSGVTSYNCCIL